MAIIPFTIVFMRDTNNKLLAHAAKVKKDELSVTETEEVDSLLEKWTTLNGLRSVLPMVGAVAAGIAVIA